MTPREDRAIVPAGMRWIHFDPEDPAEASAHARKVQQIDAWWDAFSSRRADLEAHFRGKAAWDLPAWMREHLGAVDPRLEWEYGPALAGEGHRLVITPVVEHALHPMVRTMLERAPRLAGWEFHSRHPANDFDWAMRIVLGRTGVDLAGTTVEVTRQPWGRLELCFYLPRTLALDDRRAREAVVAATQSLLGEQVLHQWIGDLEVRRQSRFHWLSVGAQRDDVPLPQLPGVVQRHVARLLDRRPDQACIDRVEDDYRLMKIPIDRVPKGTEQPKRNDMYVGTTLMPEMWIFARAELPFWSESFSRHGEVFCYVKIDGSQGLEGSSFEDKGDIEDALDEPLRAARAGCHIGGGTGLRYSYVDLSLLDVEAGIPIVRDVLCQGKVNRRTWILFFDDVLEAEWVGIFPDTPPPPRAVASTASATSDVPLVNMVKATSNADDAHE